MKVPLLRYEGTFFITQMQENSKEKLNIEDKELDFSNLDFDGRQRLVGFFSLLWKVYRENKDKFNF